MKIEPRTLKGFRDFLPNEARKRDYVINILKSVFESYDFEPLETPAIEYEEILTGKYGDEGENLMYKFEDNGGRKVALRYDQTVPLARVFAKYQNELPIPFMRYQIQNVWRGENTQKGRFREFLQCDADIVGSNSPSADARIIMVAIACLFKLNFPLEKIIIRVNDRDVFQDISDLLRKKFPTLIEKQLNLFLVLSTAIDKIKKIDESGVINELISKGLSQEEAEYAMEIVTKQKPTKRLSEILDYVEKFKTDDFKNINIVPDPTLARGLNYYTSTIFEIEIDGYTGGSVAGGGRYDGLIGMFMSAKTPAVGFSFGFDRLLEAMDELSIPFEVETRIKALITVSSETKMQSLDVRNKLRNNNIDAEIYLGDDGTPLVKQYIYAEKKNIPYTVTPNTDEAYTLGWKNEDGQINKEENISFDRLLELLRN